MMKGKNEKYMAARKTLALAGAWAVIDGVMIALVLLIFAYFHHARVLESPGEGVVSARDGSVYAGYQTDDSGVLSGVGAFDFGTKFAFDGVTTEGNSTYYNSGKYSISVTRYPVADKNAYFADIFLSDIGLLKTVMANDKYGRGQRENAELMASRSNALIAITGDNYSETGGGVVIRNGVMYSMDASGDTCVIYWTGEMDVFDRRDFDIKQVMDLGAYQAWGGGAILLEDGEIPDKFQTNVPEPCPRAAIGYFEPGHYCFFITEADTTMEELAITMRNFGCVNAYSLYGGRLAALICDFQTINARVGDRECADLIYIGR